MSTVFLSVAAATSIAQAQTMEKVKVSASFVGLWDTSQPTFCEDRGEFEKAGLDVEITSSRGGSETVQAVVAGGNDIGYSPGISAVLAAYLQGAEIKVVSSEFVGQNDSFFYVKADSPIKTVDDLAGKTVAFPRPGGDTDSVLAGLKAERNIDFTAVATGGLDATRTMTMTGQVDVGYSFPPYQLDAVNKGETRILFSGEIVESTKNVTGRVNIASKDFVEKRGDVAKKFFSVLKDCIAWTYDNLEESAKMYADLNKISIEEAKLGMQFYNEEQLALAPVKGLEFAMKRAVDAGFIKEPLTKEQQDDLFHILAE
jgi:NitT/TauT family transport system substrate-binding protein